MKTFFIEAKLHESILLSEENISKMPQKVGLVTNIQHVHKLNELKEQLEKAGKTVTIIKGFHSMNPGQMYGCDFPANADETIDCMLFVGTGKFHPRGIFDLKKQVFLYDPINKIFEELDQSDADTFDKRKKVAFTKFLHSQNIGILVSTKPGQLHMKAGEALQRIYPDKKYYYLVCDTVDFVELGNFTFIDCFVNTACPRLMEDYDKFSKPMVNIEILMSDLTPDQKAAKKFPYPIYTKIV